MINKRYCLRVVANKKELVMHKINHVFRNIYFLITCALSLSLLAGGLNAQNSDLNLATLPGGASQVDSNGGFTWAIALNDTIWRWNYSTGAWDDVAGIARRIAVAPDGIPWVVNSAGAIFKRADNTNGANVAWEKIDSEDTWNAFDIDIGADGSVWVSKDNSDDFKLYNPATNAFAYAANLPDQTPMKGISVSPAGNPWYTASNETIRKLEPTSTNVGFVYYSGNGSGAFYQVDADTWYENNSDNDFNEFKETSRDKTSITMEKTGGNGVGAIITMDLANNRILIGSSLLHPITSTKPTTNLGWGTARVEIDDADNIVFTQVSRDTWEETSTGPNTFTWTEIGRDIWSIYLERGPTTGQLDMFQNEWKLDGNFYRNITRASPPSNPNLFPSNVDSFVSAGPGLGTDFDIGANSSAAIVGNSPSTSDGLGVYTVSNIDNLNWGFTGYYGRNVSVGEGGELWIVTDTNSILTTDSSALSQESSISLPSGSVSVGEGSGSYKIAIERTGSTSAAVGVTLTVTTPSGASSKPLPFGIGVSTVTHTVTIDNNSVAEPNNWTISVSLSNPTGGADVGNSSFSITVIDDDTPAAPYLPVSTAALPSTASNSLTYDIGDYLASRNPGTGQIEIIPKIGGSLGALPTSTASIQFRDGAVATSSLLYWGNYSKDVPSSAVNTVHRFFSTEDNAFYYASSQIAFDLVVNSSAVEKNNFEEWQYVYQGATFEAAHSYPGAVPVQQFWNEETGHHFFTTSQADVNFVNNNLSPPFKYEGPAFNVYVSDPNPNAVGQETPIYRAYSPDLDRHFFTGSEYEYNLMLSQAECTFDPTTGLYSFVEGAGGWCAEGIAFWGEKL